MIFTKQLLEFHQNFTMTVFHILSVLEWVGLDPD